MRRPGSATFVVLWVGLCCCSTAHGWSKPTHSKMTAESLRPVGWLDDYRALGATPFSQMVRDVLGSFEEVDERAFRFPWSRRAKYAKHRHDTKGMPEPERTMARKLLLGPDFRIRFVLDEQRQPVSAREVLAKYSQEPDWGMDKGLTASWHQLLMGGTERGTTPSQGFRHMLFARGRLGEAPDRAALYFDLARRAFRSGHEYWGFRFAAWGLHYIEDMGTPMHTKMVPTTKLIRLRGMFTRIDDQGRKRFNWRFLKDIFKGAVTIDANHHFLIEKTIDMAYQGKSPEAHRLSRALTEPAEARRGGLRGLLQRMFPPLTVRDVASHRARSRRSAHAIFDAAMELFAGKFRQPPEGGPPNSVRRVNKQTIDRVVEAHQRRLPGEHDASLQRRMAARDTVLRIATGQFRRTGRAVRRAMELLRRDVRPQ